MLTLLGVKHKFEYERTSRATSNFHHLFGRGTMDPCFKERTRTGHRDRPDQTESSSVVPPGYVQVETGWTMTRNQEEGIRAETHEIPGTLFRVGVVNRLELRLGWRGGIWEKTRDAGQKTNSAGHGDAEVGAKLYLGGGKGWVPETALLAGVSLPVGQEELSSRRVDPTFRLVLSHHLSDRVSFGYNLGAFWESQLKENGDRDTLPFFNYTAVMGVAITARAGAFVEVFGDTPLNAAGGPKNYFDGGLTYLLRDTLQLDAAAGLGLSDDADVWFVRLGITVRLPR